MKKKFLLLCLLGFVVIGLVCNSCKKTSQDYIQTLLTGNQWQLASVQVFHFVGATQLATDTLNKNCNLTQVFKFNTDKTCTYTNFDCITQSVTGHWSLSSNELFLYADMTCQDTTAVKSSKPFQTVKIVNLGQYSLVLQTGDLETYYTPTQVRTVTQYGFIRQKTP
jgi:hypothetical protein